MKRLLILATVLAVFGLLVATATASAQQEREEVMLVIPMKYMSAATAARIFGGTVIAPSPIYGQVGFGSRGGYGGGYGTGSYQSGTSIGGGYGQSGYGQGGYNQTGYDQGGSYWR